MRPMIATVAVLALSASMSIAAAAATVKGSSLKVVAFDIEPFELAPTDELRDLLASESAVLRRALADKGLVVLDAKATRAAAIATGVPAGPCEGCAGKIARALDVDLVVTTTVQEIEYPRYNLFAVLKAAASGRELRKGVVTIDGDSEADWARGVTMLVKDHLLARPLPADSDGLRALVDKLPIPPE